MQVCSNDNEEGKTELHAGIKHEDLHVTGNCMHKLYGSFIKTLLKVTNNQKIMKALAPAEE